MNAATNLAETLAQRHEVTTRGREGCEINASTTTTAGRREKISFVLPDMSQKMLDRFGELTPAFDLLHFTTGTWSTRSQAPGGETVFTYH